MAAASLKIDARRQRILELLTQNGKVLVSELSALFGATPATIRSDLDALEQAGELERVQGGAICRVRLQPSAAQVAHLAEKQAIAAEVARRIPNGATLFLNAGTTTREIAAALRKHRNLNVVTNSIVVATELSGHPTFRVLLLGGELNVQYAFTCGGDAQEQLQKYQADFVILSIDGVCAESGVTTYHADEAIITRMMIEHAKHTIVAADHSKLGRVGFSLICPLIQVDTLITDGACDPALATQFQETGVNIVLA